MHVCKLAEYEKPKTLPILLQQIMNVYCLEENQVNLIILYGQHLCQMHGSFSTELDSCF